MLVSRKTLAFTKLEKTNSKVRLEKKLYFCMFIQGNILEDDAAIEVLTSSKCLSEELQVKETTSEETQESISQVCDL